MKYLFVGYGSLISHNSLKQTIPNKHFTPIIIKGYKRIFDLLERKNKGPDVLNLEKSKNHKFNGVLFHLNDGELKKIKKRETGYKFEQTNAYDFLTGKKIGKCMIVIDYYYHIDHKNKLPDKKYFILCREAAYHISNEFGKFWDDTTYTSDEEKISKWILKNPKYNTIKS